MIKRLVYNKKAFKILDGFTIKQSNAEVTFNDITIDFTGYSLLDIPFKYQELKIIQAETEEEILSGNGEVVFAGFLDDIDLSEMKIRKEEQRELTLTVLSPLAMSTKRYVSLIGTYSKEEAIRRVLQPLLDDGFKIVEFNIPTGQITTNFVIESVENCMNDMCFKTGIFWFIDENKNIYINSIDYLFGLGTKKTIAPDVITKGLSKIQPKIENIDYANVINFKNVRIYYSTMSMCDELNNLIEEHDYPLLNLPKKLKKGDTVQFNNPLVVSEDTLRKLREEGEVDDAGVASLSIVIGGEEFYIRIETNEKSTDYDKYVTSNNFSFSDDGGEEKTLVLQRDSFFNNLITGFKWNGADNSVVSRIYTGTALRYTTMRFMYSAEINNLKGVISDTGIVEKCIDYQEKWTTTTQLIDYARSLMTSNAKTINQVDLTFDETPNLRIGDIVEIHEPDFYIDGKFAVKEISYKYINDENEEWNIKLKNSDLNSTYIDLFRPAQKQENESKTDTVVLSEYVEDTVYEKHEIGEKETLTGDVIVVKDNDGLITIEKINGSHSQKTTMGINLFDYITSLVASGSGLTNTLNEDGSITTVGIPTANYSKVCNNVDIIDELEDEETYTILQGTKQTGLLYMAVAARKADGTYTYLSNSSNGKLTFKVDKTTYKKYLISVQSGTTANWGTSSRTITNTYMLCKGSGDKNFEPYTGGKPSPSQDFPQEVEVVKNSVKIIKRNRNQFNIAEQTIVSNGITSNYKDGKFSLAGTATTNWTLLTQNKTTFYLKKGEYTVSIYDFVENYSLDFTLYHADNTSTKMYLDKYFKHRTYTIEKDVTGLTVGLSKFKAEDTLDLEFSVQLEEGKTSTNWILPRSEEFIVPIQREMLEGDYIDNTEHHNWKKLILDGTEKWTRANTIDSNKFRFFLSLTDIPQVSALTVGQIISNSFKTLVSATAGTYGNHEGVSTSSKKLLIYTDESNTTTTAFKEWLKSKYDEGNPVIIYYKLENPIELELTDEQKAISKYLQPYDDETTILVTDKLATITASYTKKGENDEN